LNKALFNTARARLWLTALSNVIAYGQGRTDAEQITISDLTGVAIQDINIAQAIFMAS
jgi:ornithine cyclodeaminase/alanine dehydrogenase-like protein (mu-crystallin family)